MCPALIICGKHDLANVKVAKALAKNIFTAKLCLIDNVGHEINVTSSQKLANVMNAFLDTQRATA